MKRLLLLILILNNLLQANCQEKKIIIWNHLLMFKKEIKIVDSNQIYSILKKEIIDLKDNYFLVYYGQKIPFPDEYKFNYKPIEVILSSNKNGDPISYFKDFIMEDTTFHSECYQTKDFLPDGLWILIKKNNDKSINIAYQKNILKNLLNGLFITRFENNKIWELKKYNNGFIVDTTFTYDKNGNLNYISYNADTCNICNESITYSLGNIICYYNRRIDNKNFEFNINDCIRKIIKTDKGVKLYNKKGRLFKIYYYKN